MRKCRDVFLERGRDGSYTIVGEVGSYLEVVKLDLCLLRRLASQISTAIAAADAGAEKRERAC